MRPEQIPYGVKDFKATADRIFMTGVSPVTMDDLTSGFNIATNISLEPEFHAMVGFTAEETVRLFEDFRGCRNYTGEAAPHLRTVRAWYDSYCFARKMVGKESLYNCDMVLYYLGALIATGDPPEKLIGANIRSDWRKLSMILAAQRRAETSDAVLAQKHAEAVEQLKKYAADPNLPSLANGMPVHFLCYEFKGRDSSASRSSGGRRWRIERGMPLCAPAG